MYQLGWFSTGRGEGSRALLRTVMEAMRSGELKAEIAFVFCNRGPGELAATDLFLQQVDAYHLPLVTLSYRKFKAQYGSRVDPNTLPEWRLEYDREVMKRLAGFQPDLCVLAGYMLVTGPELCQKYNMINLHPAAPDGPKGTWQEVIRDLIQNKAARTGVMMHLVTPELDRGPVVGYCTFPIRGEPFDEYWRKLEALNSGTPEHIAAGDSLFRMIREHGVKREYPLIIATIKAFSEGTVRVAQGRVVDDAGNPIEGHDLTGEIDSKVG